MSRREVKIRQAQGTRKKKKKKKLSISRFLLLIAIILGISLVCVGCGYFAGAVVSLPKWDPQKLAGSESTIIYDQNGDPVSKVFAEENRTPVSLSELPSYLPDAFISAEDNRFYEHHGVDLEAIGRAVVANIRGGIGSQGGSTITQQLVKNSFLTQDKTLKRKIQEAILALEVEHSYSKEEILEFYLNRIYFGNGVYGIQTASQLYFDKNAKDLSLAESAVLAGIVKSPNNYNPFNNEEIAKNRQELVLDLMVRYGKISAAEAEEAKKEKLQYREGEIETAYAYPYYTDHVLSETEKILTEQGLSQESSQTMVYRGGLKIYTSLNTRAQKKMENIFANPANFPADQNGKQAQGAMVLLENHSGEIQALVGGRKYTTQRSFNRATQAKRQPGSAIKPLVVYAPALEKGVTTVQLLDDSPVTLGNTTFKNYDGKYRGLITMRPAVQWSINTYAVRLLNRIGVDYGYEFAKRMGITSFDDERDRNLSLALGGITYGISPLEMAGAYSAIANQGVYIKPHAVLKIIDRNGNVLYEAHPKKRVVMSEQTAYIMTDLLQTVVKSGTGTRAQLNRPVAGKTGTTENTMDIWFMGYTPEFTGAVWMGFDQEETIKDPRAAGGSFPALVWKAVVQKASEGLAVRNFPQPGGLVRETICIKSGKLPNAFCPPNHLISEIFVEGTTPKEICNKHVQVEICADSGMLASPYCPNRISAGFIDGKSGDPNEQIPTEVCNIHKPRTNNDEDMVTVKICTDPRHNGINLANTPGILETGGCPPEFVEEREFRADEVPQTRCSLPDHQVKKIDLQNIHRQ